MLGVRFEGLRRLPLSGFELRYSLRESLLERLLRYEERGERLCISSPSPCPSALSSGREQVLA